MARQLTITLDDDVAAGTAQPSPTYRVRAFHMGPPLIDLECTASALEELDRLDADASPAIVNQS